MKTRLLTGAAALFCAALLHAQTDPKKVPADARQASATAEARRQGRVALSPTGVPSPTQTMQQAIAFERYKEIAAERAAQKEGGGEVRTATAPKRKR